MVCCYIPASFGAVLYSLMSFRDSPEPRRVDLAGMFGCLADAGDAGVMALESELTTCMKEADEW